MPGDGRPADVLDRLPAVVGVFRGPGLDLAYANPRLREVPADELPHRLVGRARDTGGTCSMTGVPMAGRAWDVTAVPLPDEDAVLLHAVQASASAAAAEEAGRRYTAFVESNVIGVTITGDRELLEANDAFLDMLGYTREDLQCGLDWTELSVPEHREADERALRALRETGVAPPYEKAYLRRDGGRAEVLLSGVRISEEPLRVLATVYDLTERRAADREIRALLGREREARRAAELAHGRTRRLQDLTGSLSATLSTAEMARVVVGHALEDLSAAAGALCRVEGADVRLDYAIGYDPELLDRWRRFPLDAPTPVSDAIRERRPVTLFGQAARDAYPEIGPEAIVGSVVALPLVVRDDVLGALALSFDSDRPLSPEDLDFLVALGQQAATAMERAELFEDRAYVARKLQEGLLPRRLEPVAGLETAVRYSSISGGGEVGGDFYDLFGIPGGRWVVAVGDVCGKGTEAAVVTGLARHTVRAAGRLLDRPGAMLGFLNDALREHGAAPSFCTVLCGVLSPGPGPGFRAELASGGHPLPLVLRSDGSLEAVEVTGTMLGVAPDPSLREVEVRLGPADALVLYTDGVTDARRPGGPRFGEAALRATVQAAAGRDADGIAAAVEAAVREHDPGPPADDRAVLVLRVAPG